MQGRPSPRIAPAPPNTLGGLIADGGTAFTIPSPPRTSTPRNSRKPIPGRITAVVLLTDGEDTDSHLKLDQLLAMIRFDSERRTIRVFTIAYGADADVKILQSIADATQAKSYKGTPENIRNVFRDIATFF